MAVFPVSIANRVHRSTPSSMGERRAVDPLGSVFFGGRDNLVEVVLRGMISLPPGEPGIVVRFINRFVNQARRDAYLLARHPGGQVTRCPPKR